jgi:hypothetical protein
MTASSDWTELLSSLNAAAVKRGALEGADIPPEVMAKQWCGGPPASEVDIRAVEERLGVRLPPSYSNFLRAANGWWHFDSSIYRILSTTEITWFRVAQPVWFSTWMEGVERGGESSVPDELYFDYEAAAKHPIFRQEYLPDCLAISDVGDSAILLLNPKVITDAGEWEAWFCATWAAGAFRYRSFREFVQATIESEEQSMQESGRD